jgi:hypothetical protein
MTGIDTAAIASLLAGRINGLLTNGIGSFSNPTSARTNTCAPALDSPVAASGGTAAAAQASAQTVLSELALALDALSRLGGQATPAMTGQTPVWPAPPAIDVPCAMSGEPRLSSDPAALAATTPQRQGAVPSPSAMPVARLAAALARTVSESGLFYESHLAQWLTGLRSFASLLGEPQTRLTTQAEPPEPGTLDAIPARSGTTSAPPPATVSPANNAEPTASASAAISIPPATIPLVRQQLDLLATGQFRWTGEAWPGAKLDWTIESGDKRQGDHYAATAVPEPTWRTRLTLTLPRLGVVEAELTLTGAQLLAQVRASPECATRLAAESDAFRHRLRTAGMTLSALSIREIRDASPSAHASAASMVLPHALPAPLERGEP